MTNRDIAKSFQELGQLMELHQENPFKIRSYSNAYRSLRKIETPLFNMQEAELSAIKGVGKAIAGKIRELAETGRMETLERYRELTPPGIREMLNISGFGPKKVRVVWKELGVESVGELLYAVNENRLIELKGFGAKTQEDLRQKLEYYQRNRDNFLYATLLAEAKEVLTQLKALLPDTRIELVGQMRRKDPTPSQIEILIGEVEAEATLRKSELFQAMEFSPNGVQALSPQEYPLCLYFCHPQDFGSKLFRFSASKNFMQAFLAAYPNQDFRHFEKEESIFEQLSLAYIAPELREDDWSLELAQQNQLPVLVETKDIVGVVHAHTTYSDGIHSLEQMVAYAQEQGFAYLTITDHSQAAFYANGLKPDRIWEQMAAIDELNKKVAPFRIFKGTESDILNDGSLDYEADILAALDIVIASVHSNLRMDEAKATQRIITAVENPYTHILGHPTGRLLLSRRGYPIDHKKIIDACAANGVAIEMNANPYRLDLDWSWIPYALEKGVWISINPDAHSTGGMHDIQYGVAAARKGGLSAAQCLNAQSVHTFAEWLQQKGT